MCHKENIHRLNVGAQDFQKLLDIVIFLISTIKEEDMLTEEDRQNPPNLKQLGYID